MVAIILGFPTHGSRSTTWAVGHFGEEDRLYLFARIRLLGSVEESGVFFLELRGQCLDSIDDVGMLQNVEFLVHFDVRLPA